MFLLCKYSGAWKWPQAVVQATLDKVATALGVDHVQHVVAQYFESVLVRTLLRAVLVRRGESRHALAEHTRRLTPPVSLPLLLRVVPRAQASHSTAPSGAAVGVLDRR